MTVFSKTLNERGQEMLTKARTLSCFIQGTQLSDVT